MRKAEPTREDVRGKLDVAIRDLKDAEILQLSFDTRFRLAGEAMLVVARALMLADGFRPVASGSHYRSMESLEHTWGSVARA